MTLKELIDLQLNEGIAENSMNYGFDLNKMKNYLNQEKIKLLKYKAEKENFLFQYETAEKFLNRAYDMYNHKLKTGFEINNSKQNFENTMKPILLNFYNSIVS